MPKAKFKMKFKRPPPKKNVKVKTKVVEVEEFAVTPKSIQESFINNPPKTRDEAYTLACYFLDHTTVPANQARVLGVFTGFTKPAVVTQISKQGGARKALDWYWMREQSGTSRALNGSRGAGAKAVGSSGVPEYDGDGKEPFQEAQRRNQVALANQNEIKAEQLRGKLVPRDDITNFYAERVMKARDTIMQMPNMVQLLRQAPTDDEAQALIESECRRALAELEQQYQPDVTDSKSGKVA